MSEATPPAEVGTVRERRPDGRVLVEVSRSSACAGCHARGVCVPGEHGTALVVADDPLGARPGDRVMVATAGDVRLAAALWAYALPLATLLLGGLGAWLVQGDGVVPATRDVVAALAALAGALVGWGALALLERRVRRPGSRLGGRLTVRVTGPYIPPQQLIR